MDQGNTSLTGSEQLSLMIVNEDYYADQCSLTNQSEEQYLYGRTTENPANNYDGIHTPKENAVYVRNTLGTNNFIDADFFKGLSMKLYGDKAREKPIEEKHSPKRAAGGFVSDVDFGRYFMHKALKLKNQLYQEKNHRYSFGPQTQRNPEKTIILQPSDLQKIYGKMTRKTVDTSGSPKVLSNFYSNHPLKKKSNGQQNDSKVTPLVRQTNSGAESNQTQSTASKVGATANSSVAKSGSPLNKVIPNSGYLLDDHLQYIRRVVDNKNTAKTPKANQLISLFEDEILNPKIITCPDVSVGGQQHSKPNSPRSAAMGGLIGKLQLSQLMKKIEGGSNSSKYIRRFSPRNEISSSSRQNTTRKDASVLLLHSSQTHLGKATKKKVSPPFMQQEKRGTVIPKVNTTLTPRNVPVGGFGIGNRSPMAMTSRTPTNFTTAAFKGGFFERRGNSPANPDQEGTSVMINHQKVAKRT